MPSSWSLQLLPSPASFVSNTYTKMVDFFSPKLAPEVSLCAD